MPPSATSSHRSARSCWACWSCTSGCGPHSGWQWGAAPYRSWCCPSGSAGCRGSHSASQSRSASTGSPRTGWAARRPGAARSAVKTAAAAPLAAAYLLWLGSSGTFTGHGVEHALLLMSTGVVDALPLLLFGAAARRLPLSVVGMLQYLEPALLFVIGLLVFGEQTPSTAGSASSSYGWRSCCSQRKGSTGPGRPHASV